MSLLDTFRKGFRFFLMSMGVSTYARKTPPKTEVSKSSDTPASKPE
jgi:hypothetical protein